MVLHREGLGYRAIARQLRISRTTVRRYISSPGFPNDQKALGCMEQARASWIPTCRTCVSNGTPEYTTVRASLSLSKNVAIYAAVYAACSRPESNGITEGHVNRLKFLKRQMFGRAHLDLLRVKVLRAV